MSDILSQSRQPTDQEPPFARQVLMSPLHMELAGESTTNSWTSFNGYSVPARLTSCEAEYQALRYGAAMADFSPLVKYSVTGAEALSYLQRLITGNASTLEIGSAMNVIFCEDRGLVVGTGRLMRLAEEAYRLVTPVPHLDWLMSAAIGFRVDIEDVSTRHVCIALLGPLAQRVLAQAIPGINLSIMTADKAQLTKMAGMPVFILANAMDALAPGYEFWVDVDDAVSVWRHLRRCTDAANICAIGWDVLDLARIENGLPRAGQDFETAFAAVAPDAAITPFEMQAGSLCDFSKGHFTGRMALLALRDASPMSPLIHLQIEGLEPVICSAVMLGQHHLGRVSSSIFSPAKGANIVLARARMTGSPKAKDAPAPWLVAVEDNAGIRGLRRATPVGGR